MARDSTGTQLNFDNARPADPDCSANPPSSIDAVSQSEAKSRPTVPIKDVGNAFEKIRKRPVEDEGANNTKSRFPMLLASRLQKIRPSAEADHGHGPQGTSTVTIQGLPGDKALPHNASSTRIPRVQPTLTVKDESPWKNYNKEYQIELGGLVTVAERKHPASGLVTIKELLGPSAKGKLSVLSQTQTSHFVSCVEVVHFENGLHVISEHMALSLVQIIAAPRYPCESHVAAIIGQILGGIEFLEFHQLVHGNITCSSVLLNQKGVVKIANQECCRTASPEDIQDHPDSQALGDIMMQLLEKRNRRSGTLGAEDLHRWSPPAAGFLSETLSASAKELAQHAFLQNGWRKEDLLSLVSFAQIASRRQYRVDA